MELPYIVEARKDTGLFNSKLAIWLFLASEVMLFGGLFSGYVFLRIYADFPWPERAIPVVPGLINTVMLILSSVTVVFAWSELKFRNYRKFQIYMGATLFFAAAFLGFKYVEYTTKFHHQAVRMQDGVVVEGHVEHAAVNKEGKLVYGEEAKKINDEHHGDGHHLYAKLIEYKAEEIGIPLKFSFRKKRSQIIENILEQAHHQHSKLILNIDSEKEVVRREKIAKALENGAKLPTVEYNNGDEVTLEFLKASRKFELAVNKYNAKLSKQGLKDAWTVAWAEDAARVKAGEQAEKSKGWQLASKVGISKEVQDLIIPSRTGLSTKFEKPVYLHFGRNDIIEGEKQGVLKDGSLIQGKQLKSYMDMHIDAVDFQYLALEFKKKGEVRVGEKTYYDVFEAIEHTWLLHGDHHYAHHFHEYWEKHIETILEHNEHLRDYYKKPENAEFSYKGQPLYLPMRDIFRLSWQSIVAYDTHYGDNADFSTTKEVEDSRWTTRNPVLSFMKSSDRSFPHLKIPNKEVYFESTLTPKWNNFYAIYFTITGLHGLHIIGGMIVLGWFGFMSKKIYDKDPEWLANRVEVGGLFWHFVDLVWIFVFPIFYLM